MSLTSLKRRLRECVNEEKRDFFPKFFKTGKGEYGEGDCFLGVIMPDIRAIAQEHRDLSPEDCKKLLASKWHEERLLSLVILVNRFKKADEATRKGIYDLYLECIAGVNGWDLVDVSAHVIVGGWLVDKSRKSLYPMARSKNLWKRRIAMIATFHFIRNNDFKDAMALAEILVNDSEDLMHKAVGWMLREVGKRDMDVECAFLDRHAATMPRTMLRYAIEKFPEGDRQVYLKAKNG